MSNSDSPESKPNLLDSKLLRREAGEGWHPNGLNKTLLGALVVRESLMDMLSSDTYYSNTQREELFEEFEAQLLKVKEIKTEFDVGQPPMEEI